MAPSDLAISTYSHQSKQVLALLQELTSLGWAPFREFAVFLLTSASFMRVQSAS
jgi:hypothetical protein